MSQPPKDIEKPENWHDTTADFLRKTKELFDLENNQVDTPTPTTIASLSCLGLTSNNSKVLRVTSDKGEELEDDKESETDSNPSNIVGFPKRSS